MPSFRLPDAHAYLVALSGGADSRLLLELAVRARAEQTFPSDGEPRIMAAHLHHGIRGSEADRDEDFCRRICSEAGIPLVTEHADIPALAEESGESIETAARRMRYEFFRRVMTEQHIPVLLTAHHADDNLETILDRLLRGSGTRGMGGIPPTRLLGHTLDGKELTVFRPLLAWTKKDILDACAELGLDYVTDSTNSEIAYTRNRLRHTVIPALEELAGDGIPQRTAYRLARSAREDEACLMGLAEAQVTSYTSPDGGLYLDCLQNHYPAIAKRMMAILYDRATADSNPRDGSGTLTTAHLDALRELVEKGIPETSVTLPRGMEGRVRDGTLIIRPMAATEPILSAEPIPLTLGLTHLGNGLSVLVEASPTLLSPSDEDGVWASAILPPDLPLPLLARRRLSGDELLSHGMHKKLKKLLCDHRIPPHLRNQIPLICLPDGTPLWYPAAVFRDGYPAPREGACLRVTVFLERI